MGDKTGIAWTDATWNPIVGCSVVSPGCANCYAMKEAGGRMRHTTAYRGLTTGSRAGPVWNGLVRLIDDRLSQPIRWARPRRIFVNSMGDLFHEAVPDDWILDVLAVTRLTPHHQYQILTKRASRMDLFMNKLGRNLIVLEAAMERIATMFDVSVGLLKVSWPLPNVWFGVSAEDQERWKERRLHLRCTPAAIRFVSVEPQLGPIRLAEHDDIDLSWLHWVIAGGESGPVDVARLFDIRWATDLSVECSQAGIPFFLKQLGSNFTPRGGLLSNVHHRKGADPDEWPVSLRIQEYPA